MVQLYKRKGGEVLVNTETTGTQSGGNIAVLPGGGFVIVWSDGSAIGADTSSLGVKAQLFDAGGTKVGGEFLVNTTTTGNQSGPTVASLASGRFVVTWSDASATGGDTSGIAVRAQMFEANGTPFGGEFLVNTATVNNQLTPAITELSGGGFVIAWSDNSGVGGDTSGTAVKAQVFSATGTPVGSEFLVNTTTAGSQGSSGINLISLASGGFGVAYGTVGSVAGTVKCSVFVQLFDAAGTKVGAEQIINLNPDGNLTSVNITALNAGFVVTWAQQDSIQYPGVPITYDLHAQLFDANGVKVGADFIVNTTLAGSQTSADVDRLPGGGFLVTWQGTAVGGTETDIFGQFYDDNGHRVGGEFLVTTLAGYQTGPKVDVLASGDIVLLWTDPSGVGGDSSGSGVKMQILTLSQDAPTDITISGTNLNEVAIENLAVATLGATNGSAVNSHFTYQIISDSTGGAFRIDGNQLVVADNARLDFETAPIVEVRVRVTDLNGTSYEETFSLNVGDSVTEARYAAGTTFVANTADPGFVNPIGSAALASGGFVVLEYWTNITNLTTGYRAQIFDAVGNKVGAELSPFGSAVDYPTVAGLPSGGFIITYAASGAIKAQLYDAAGGATGAPLTVTPAGGGFYGLDVIALKAGGFVVTWTGGGEQATGDNYDGQIRARVYDAAGQPLGGDFRANTGIEGAQRFSHVEALPDGGFVITWTDESAQGAYLEGQRFDAAGNKVGPELSIASGFNHLITGLAVLTDGKFVVTWSNLVTESDLNLHELRAQIVGTDGVNIGGPITIGFAASIGETVLTYVSATADGGFVVNWDSLTADSQSEGDTTDFARFFDGNGVPVGETFAVTDNGQAADGPGVLLLASGDLVFTWYQGSVVNGEPHSVAGGRILDYLGTGQPTIGPTPGPDTLDGTADADTIDGLGGNDVIHGLGGDDVLYGGAGDDQLFGDDGNDTLNGGSGLDQMAGGTGNDIYIVDDAGDQVIEAAGQGYDVVYTSVSYTLAAGQEIEGLVALDFAGTAPLNLTGNAFANYLLGNAGANVLNGGAGADAMEGRGGNDIYIADNAGDVVIEAAGQGYDVVYASVSYTLTAGQEIEGLVTSDFNATTALALTGNEFANYLQGNNGANQLNGGAGADAMEGLGGNDIYVVDNAGDLVIEAAGKGYDVVYSSVSYALAAGQEVEGLVALDPNATTALALTGNEIANYLIGNAGANQLNGGAGADAMEGRGGNDIYIVDNVGDLVIEAAGQGYDVVYTTVSYALNDSSEVEGLVALDFAGTAALNLTGNALANYLIGNDGANVLNGGAGSDALYGRGGADIFVFANALGPNNIDFIGDFNAADDTIQLDHNVFAGLTIGALGAGAFVIGTQAGDVDDRIIYNQATGQLFFDADGSGSGAAVLFATLNGAPVISASDFVVI